MFRRCLSLSFLIAGAAHLGSFGCARELEFTEPVDPTGVVRAQFDPTHPVPVLRLVPTPTGIVQDPQTGTLDYARVAPQTCEVPSTKQCLQFVRGGWPVSTPITLLFSGEIDAASIPQGLRLFELGAGGIPAPVPFTASVGPRPAPNPSCQEGGNGSDFTFKATDVPPGVQVVLTPEGGMKPGTRYALLAVSTETSGLRDVNGRRVEASSLFYLLNVPPSSPPVDADGNILDALLRSNVTDSILRSRFPGKKATDLTAEEQQAFAAASKASGLQLYGLFQFFSSVVEPFVAAGVVANRSDVVFANGWSTEVPVVDLDPGDRKFPFPSAEVMTATAANTVGGLRVSLPNPTMNPVITGLNTLNGFSTTASITVTTTGDVDPMSIDPTPLTPCSADDCAVVMYPVGPSGLADATGAIDLLTEVIPGVPTSTVTFAPVLPLAQNQRYVVAIKRGLRTVSGVPLGTATGFDLLKLNAPFIQRRMEGDMEITVVPDTIEVPGASPFPLRQALECSFVEDAGRLGTAPEVVAAAASLELAVRHDRWLETLSQIEGGVAPLTRNDLLIAFSYKTQSITQDLDFIEGTLLDPPTCTPSAPCWDLLLGGAPRLVETASVSGSAAIADVIGVVELLCLPICQAGAMAPAIPPEMCTVPDGAGGQDVNPAVATQPLCLQTVNLTTSRLAEVHRYDMKGFRVIAGNPNAAGTFTPATVGRPQVVDIPIWVVIPEGATGPVPVTIVQHGLGRTKQDGFLIANTLASLGRAAVMMDLPFHGDRASDISRGQERCPNVDPGRVTCVDGACVDDQGAQPCDGVQDDSGTGFLSVNLFATRDNLRQSVIDHLTLLRTIRLEGRAGGRLPQLDGTRVTYIGQSLGAVTGGNLAAFVNSNEISRFVLNAGGGGNFHKIILNSIPEVSAGLFAGLAQAGICILKDPANPGRGCEDTPAFRRFKVIAQWVMEPADPVATSIGVTQELAPGRTPLGSQNVLMQISMPDPVVANVGSYALAEAYFEEGTMSDQFQVWDFRSSPDAVRGGGCHGYLFAPVCGRCLIDSVCITSAAQAQATAFITQGTIIDRATATGLAQQTTGLPCNNPCP